MPERPHTAPALIWAGLYLALVIAPIAILLVGPSSSSLGYWWDFSAALGFSALATMGAQTLLTARLRKATAPFGIDVIYFFHRYIGIVLLFLLLAHPALLIYDNPALVSYLNPFTAPLHIAAGVLSATAILLLSATSLWRKSLRLRYERWRIAHLVLAAAAVVLALVHIEGVGYYTATPVMRVYWRVFLIGWLGGLAYVRLFRPWQVSRAPYRVVDVVGQRGDAWTIALRPERHPGITFQPGQFGWLSLGTSPFAMSEHPFSFSSRPGLPGGQLEFTIKELGDFTRTIGQTGRGTVAFVDGPYGAFTIDRHPAPGVVFIAGGIGIAPIMSMLRTLAARGDRRPVLLIYACSRLERMTFKEELDALSTTTPLQIVRVLEDPPDDWAGERGWVTTALLDRHLPENRQQCAVFVCGPEAMREAIEHQLHQLGLPLSHVHSELFDIV